MKQEQTKAQGVSKKTEIFFFLASASSYIRTCFYLLWRLRLSLRLRRLREHAFTTCNNGKNLVSEHFFRGGRLKYLQLLSSLSETNRFCKQKKPFTVVSSNSLPIIMWN